MVEVEVVQDKQILRVEMEIMVVLVEVVLMIIVILV